MAKEVKNTKATEVKNVATENNANVDVVENIETAIKNENKMDEKVLKMAQEQIQKEKDERKAAILKNAICKADYINKRELLDLRKRRKEEAITKKTLAKSKELLDKLINGEYTPTEYENALAESDKEKREAFIKLEDENRVLIQELRNNYPSYYCYDWEFERRCRNW